jgi:hypothetical protein
MGHLKGNIMIKRRRMRWAGHVALIAGHKKHTKSWLESWTGRNRLEDLGVER